MSSIISFAEISHLHRDICFNIPSERENWRFLMRDFQIYLSVINGQRREEKTRRGEKHNTFFLINP